MYLGLLVALPACAVVKVSPVNYRGYSVEKEIVPYLVKFEENCKTPVKIHIRFERIKWDIWSDEVAAYCFKFGVKYIHVDYDWWVSHTLKDVREELIYHELGHCLLNRGHDKTKLFVDYPGGRPKSIMYPYVFGYWGEYGLHREYYIKELCGDE